MDQMVTSAELHDESEEQIIAQDLRAIVAFLERHRLSQMALLALEMHRPLAGVLHALTAVSVVFLSPILGATGYQRLERTLAEPERVQRLMELLERQLGKDSGVHDASALPCEGGTQLGRGER